MRHLVSIAVVLVLVLHGSPPAVVTAQDASLLDLLPTAQDIGPGYAVAEQRLRALDDQATGFSDAGEAARLLAEWGWQANAFTVFQATDLTSDGAPAATVDISLTRFADAAGAAQALPYYLADRAAVLGQQEARDLQSSPVGDETRILAGTVGDGASDRTLYARSGPLLLRVSATVRASAPHAADEQIARGIFARVGEPSSPVVLPQSVAAYLPDTLPLPDAACSRVDEGHLDVATQMERFDGIADAAATLAGMGWQEGAARQFGCDDVAPGGAGWVTMSASRFRDAGAATDAVGIWAESRARVAGLQLATGPDLGDSTAALAGPAVNGTEYTLYVSRGALLFRVTGVGPTGDPRADVETIATALVDRSFGTEDVGIPSPPSQVIAVAATATPVPVPTATAIPTPFPAPTATAMPIPTATPVPTMTPMPPAPVPTATAIPPAPPPPPPTATAGPLPTPTPRVIHPPTPGAG